MVIVLELSLINAYKTMLKINLQKIMSRNFPFSNKINPHLQIPGSSFIAETERILRCLGSGLTLRALEAHVGPLCQSRKIVPGASLAGVRLKSKNS